MPFAIVIAPPEAYRQAAALAAELTALGVTSSAPDLEDKWNESGWRQVNADWPQSAFVVLCLTKGSARDVILNNVIWRAVPLDKDQTGRFVFAVFDPEAKEKFASFVEAHFSAPGGDVARIADHIQRHEAAMNDFLRQQEERRKAAQEAALRQPPRVDLPDGRVGAGDRRGPPGVGAADVGGGGWRRPEGIGAADGPVRVGGERRSSNAYEEFSRGEASASAAPAPAHKTRAMIGMGSPIGEDDEPTADKPAKKSSSAKLDKVESMAFAPRKLRRGTTELIRVAIFQPKDRGRAATAAKQADARTQGAGVAQALGQIARGTSIAAVIEARGALIEDMREEAEWTGAPLDFNFPVEPSLDPAEAQAFFRIRILADDAQIGAITFVRPLVPPRKSGAASKLDSREKLRRVNRVFLSYSSNDRTPVSLIASAYQRAGVRCFFDRTSLKSGEEWSPRLRAEIERADLFHLCWSKQAAASEWVERETTHALSKRRKSGGKRPDITIQMLDGPPWAPHPQSLNDLNFDDYARAAIVGYARGDGG